MDIKDIKKEMKNYRDFYGGKLLGETEIEKAETIQELNDIIEQHRGHLESMLSDADNHLDRLKIKIGF